MTENKMSSTASSASNTMYLPIKLMSGDILTIQVDASKPVRMIPIKFAEQHHYAMSAIRRMVFLHLEADSETVVWSPEMEESDVPISQHFGKSDIHLNLVIRSLQEPTRRKTRKIEHLRKILQEEDRFDEFSNEELYSLYSEWVLTSHLPSKTCVNQMLRTFVDERPEQFHLLNPEQVEERKLRKQVESFRHLRNHDNMIPLLSQIDFDWHVAHYHRVIRDGQVLSMHEVNMLIMYISIPQLLQIGLTHGNFPREWAFTPFIAEWDRFNALALQMDQEVAV